MIIETDFVNHWKTRALATAVGRGEALQALLLLWGHCQTRKAWEFELTPLMLAGICSYEGEAEKLWKAMMELRWIVPAVEPGWFQVRGWGEVNASLVGKWAGGLRKQGAGWHARGYGLAPATGATIGSTSGQPQATIGASNGSTSAASSGPTDLIGLDRIRDERKSTPKAPKGAHTLPEVPEEWSELRKTVMLRWFDYRRGLRKPVKLVSMPALLEKLAVLTDEQLDLCVAESVANGWTGLFPEKFTLPPPTGSAGDAAKNREKKEGGAAGGVRKIKAADFPWRVVAKDYEGWEPEGEWEDQTARTRQTLREAWSALPAQTKAAFWELSQGGAESEKKEGAAGDVFECPTPCDWREHWAECCGLSPDRAPETWEEVVPAMRRRIVALIEKKKGGGAE